jgi:hypothetical protein
MRFYYLFSALLAIPATYALHSDLSVNNRRADTEWEITFSDTQNCEVDGSHLILNDIGSAAKSCVDLTNPAFSVIFGGGDLFTAFVYTQRECNGPFVILGPGSSSCVPSSAGFFSYRISGGN